MGGAAARAAADGHWTPRQGEIRAGRWYRARFSRVTAHKHGGVEWVGRLSISGIRSCSGTGTYRWKIWNEGSFGRGYQLAFTKIHDACKLRVNLWTDHGIGRNTRW